MFTAHAVNPLQGLIDVIITIAGSPLSLGEPLISADDFSTQGVQIAPFPGKARNLSIMVTIESNGGRQAVQGVELNAMGMITPCTLPSTSNRKPWKRSAMDHPSWQSVPTTRDATTRNPKPPTMRYARGGAGGTTNTDHSGPKQPFQECNQFDY